MQHVSFFLLALGKALADMRPPTSYSPVNRSLLIISKNKNPPWNQPGAQKSCLSSRDFTAAHPNPQPDLECQVSFLSRSLYFIPSEDLDVVEGENFRQTQFHFLWFFLRLEFTAWKPQSFSKSGDLLLQFPIVIFFRDLDKQLHYTHHCHALTFIRDETVSTFPFEVRRRLENQRENRPKDVGESFCRELHLRAG